MRGYNYSQKEYGEDYPAILAAGLLVLGPEFMARLCPSCDGKGEREQTYTAGCGGGYFKSMGECEHCKGIGLLQGSGVAPVSVVAQVAIAGAAFLNK